MRTSDEYAEEMMQALDRLMEQRSQSGRRSEYHNVMTAFRGMVEQRRKEADAALSAAESRGYERAREQAAGTFDGYAREAEADRAPFAAQKMRQYAATIRAMTDGRGEAEPKFDVCAVCLRPIETRRDGRWHHVGREPGGHCAGPW